MKSRLFAILLLFAMYFSLPVKVFRITDFLLNQEKLTEKFCENKKRTDLRCNGNCHLNKELKKTEGQAGKADQLPVRTALEERFGEYEISRTLELPASSAVICVLPEIPFSVNIRYPQSDVFHPPC